MDTLNIWNTINGRLTNFVLGKVKDVDLTKDIVQDVFLKVFTKSETVRNKDKMIAWVYQIARNEVVDHFRKAKVDTIQYNVEIREDLDGTYTSEVAQCLRPLMNALPDKYKEALILADIEKVPQKEIAKRLNISYSGAKSRVQRGREMLKTTMEQCCTITTDVYGDVLEYQQKRCDPDDTLNCEIDCS